MKALFLQSLIRKLLDLLKMDNQCQQLMKLKKDSLEIEKISGATTTKGRVTPKKSAGN